MTGRSFTFGLLALLVTAFPWDDVLGYPSETISVVKLLGLAVGMSFVATMAWRSPFVVAPTLPAVAAFVVVVFASLLVSGDAGSGVAQTVRYVLFAGLFFLVTQIVHTRAELIVLFVALTASAAIASAVGVVRFLDGVAGRASGPIGEANDFAYVLATALPFGVYLVSRGGRGRIGWFAAVAMIGVAILGTLSRGTLVGLAVAVIWLAVRGRINRRAVAVAAASIAAIAAVAATVLRDFVADRLRAKGRVADANIESRVALWRGALDMAVDHPLIGVGTGLYRTRAIDYVFGDPLNIVEPVAHNAYLEILAENGVLGLAAFGAFIVGTWLVLRTAHRNAVESADRDAAHLVTALQVSYIAAVVGAMFLSVQIAPPLWLLGALAVTMGAITGRGERATVRP